MTSFIIKSWSKTSFRQVLFYYRCSCIFRLVCFVTLLGLYLIIWLDTIRVSVIIVDSFLYNHCPSWAVQLKQYGENGAFSHLTDNNSTRRISGMSLRFFGNHFVLGLFVFCCCLFYSYYLIHIRVYLHSLVNKLLFIYWLVTAIQICLCNSSIMVAFNVWAT